MRAATYSKSWQRGIFTYKIPVAVNGIVWKFDRRSGAGFLRAKNAIVFCHWYRNAVPPHVQVGAKVTVVGDLMTACCGDTMHLMNCAAFKAGASWGDYRAKILDMMRENIVPVNDYVDEQTEENYGVA